MTDEIKAAVEEVRRSGICNMLDLPFVQRVAFDKNLYCLVTFIEEHRSEYIHYIFYGDDGGV
ncbi:MAG: DUF5049 domain-containing protein [Eubacterium sp.]